jgi:hypothetical protein
MKNFKINLTIGQMFFTGNLNRDHYINGSDADIRAQIVLHMNNAISWSGVPLQLLETDNKLFVVLELVSTSPSQQKSNLLLDLTYLQALEISSPANIISFLTKPWLLEQKYQNITKLHLMREMDAISKELSQFQIKLDVESFPLTDDTFGALLALVHILQFELSEISKTDFGRQALLEIKEIQIGFESDKNVCIKLGTKLIFSINLQRETFQRKLISELLNTCL